jgi:hypothetical protein
MRTLRVERHRPRLVYLFPVPMLKIRYEVHANRSIITITTSSMELSRISICDIPFLTFLDL